MSAFNLRNVNLAILGAGRSGVAIAKAATARGATATLYDAKPLNHLEIDFETIHAMGVHIEGTFNGPFTPGETDIIVTSPGVDHRSPILQEAKQKGIQIIGEIEFAYRIARAPIIGITGTNGKSTTTLLTYLCLQDVGAILCGNIYGSGYEEIPLTEAADQAAQDQVLVAEISSFQLEWIEQFRPHCAAITNIAPDHLNRYDSFQQYAETKRKIYMNMGGTDVYVRHPDPMTYAEPAPFVIRETEITNSSIVLPDFEIPLRDLPFTEHHNIKNGAMAALLAHSYLTGFTQVPFNSIPATLVKGLQSFKGLGHRMERLGSRFGVQVINNSMCTNPAALIASSSAVPAHQRLLIGGLTKDLDFTPVREFLHKAGHDVYLYGKDAAKINSQLGGGYPVFNTMAEAFKAAIAAAKSGEVVMLAPGCASLDQYADFRARGEEFRKLAKEWLQHEHTATH